MTTEASGLTAAERSVRRTVQEFDRACSRFRDDSELAALNRAGGRPLRVSPLLIQAVQAALRAAELTDGDVDPTLGSALVALGYDRDFDQVHAVPAPPSLTFVSVAGWRTITIQESAGTVRLGEGVRLDLGATAKALAADHAAAAAHEAAGCGVLVSLGGDISTAGPAPEPGWPVRVTDNHRAGPDVPGQSITISAGGLATSSTAVRRWRAGAETVHHLLDPATGRPTATGLRTASVAAATCLDANIATTAAIVRGLRASAWLESAGLPSRLVGDDGRVRHVAGWPAGGEDLETIEPSPAPSEVLT